VSDAVARRSARRAAVLECAAAAHCPAVAGHAVAAGLAAAVAERVVPAAFGLIAVAVGRAVAVCSGPAAAAEHAVSAAFGLTAVAAEHAAVAEPVVAERAVPAAFDLTAVAAEHAAVAEPVVVERAAVAEHAVVWAWLAPACSVVVRDGLAFRPAARAVRKQERRFREAATKRLC